MNYTIHYMPKAQQDIIHITHYLSQFYPSTPTRFHAELERNLKIVAFNPRCCPRYEHRPEFRKLNVKNYLVFYWIDEDEKCVKIYRIFHGSQNIENI